MMTSVKIVTVDYYLSYPVKDLDVCYSEFRGTEVRQVPVLQIFGSTPEGTKTCVHIHGVLPYVYIPYDGVEPATRLSYQLAAEIDRTLNISLGQASANSRFVHNIVLVSGLPLYGYHEKEHQYFKIFFYNPMIVKKACSLLENGVILGKHFQPHESHINYVLQFMIDYNLQGMNYIHLSRVMYRVATEHPGSLDNIPVDQILPGSVQRRTFSRLECDALARDIINIEEVCSGQLAVNPGLAALWDDERQRRRNNALDSQISFCLTQDRPKPAPTVTHRLFKQKLREKLTTSSATSGDSSELERSVYPAETPADAELLNASVVLSNALTTPSNGTNVSSVAADATSVVMDRADLSVLHLLEDLKAGVDDTVLEESFVEGSPQHEQDVDLLKVLEELRERANVEEDSILSQTLVQHSAGQLSSDDDEVEEDEHKLSLPLVDVSETGEINDVDDESVWENSYWDENCEIPQIDGQCDSSSNYDSSDDDNLSDILDKRYAFNMARFSDSDPDEKVRVAKAESPGQLDTRTVHTDVQYYQAEQNDNCCFFPDTQMTDTRTQCSAQAMRHEYSRTELRKANEVYIVQNEQGTLRDYQLLAPGINRLKAASPCRRASGRKKIEITEVIINPGLDVARLTRDLTRCTVQLEPGGKTVGTLPGSNSIRTVDSAARLSNEGGTNSHPAPPSYSDDNSSQWEARTSFTDVLRYNESDVRDVVYNDVVFGSTWNTPRKCNTQASTITLCSPFKNSGSPGNDSELFDYLNQSDDAETTAPTVGRTRRRRTYPSFTKSQTRRLNTNSASYRYRERENSSAEAYDLRPKRTKQMCFCCRTDNDTSLGNNNCKESRYADVYKRKYTMARSDNSLMSARKTQEPFKLVMNEKTLNVTVDSNEEHRAVIHTLNETIPVEVDGSQTECVRRRREPTTIHSAEDEKDSSFNKASSLRLKSRETRSQTCADADKMADSVRLDRSASSVRNVPGSVVPSTHRMKRKHAARCENRMRRIQQLENSESEQEEQVCVKPEPPAPVKQTKPRQFTRRMKKVQQLRGIQRKIRKFERAMTRYDDTSQKMKLAMRWKRLQQERRTNIGEQQAIGRSVTTRNTKLVHVTADSRPQSNDTSCLEVKHSVCRTINNKLPCKADVTSRNTNKHHFSTLVTNVVSIASTTQTTAVSNNMTPANCARDDCIVYEVTHSANCSHSSGASSVSLDALPTQTSELNTDAAVDNSAAGSERSLAEQTPPPSAEVLVVSASFSSSRPSQMDRSALRRYPKICDNNCDAAQGNTESQTSSSNIDASPTLEWSEESRQNVKPDQSQTELALAISARQQEEEEVSSELKRIQSAPGIADKKFIRWNVDGANDTLSSSDSSVPEHQCCRVTRRRKLTSKSHKSTGPGEMISVSSDSDNTTTGNLGTSVHKQTRSKTKQLPAKPERTKTKLLLPKQLRVSLVPLEFLITSSKTKSSDKRNRSALPTKRQLNKTTSDASNGGGTVKTLTPPHEAKPKPTRTSPRFSTLAVTIRSPKSKRQQVNLTAEPELKRIKIAEENLKTREESSGKDNTMEVDRHAVSGELQMIGIIPIIQNSNTGKKLQARSLKSKTTCDIVNQNNSKPTSIISEPSQCDKTRINVKKQLFSSKPPPPPSASRKTIIVNINTDTNTTFVEEHKVCAYEKSHRNSVEPTFVQIQRLKDLIAKEEKCPVVPAHRRASHKMDDAYDLGRPDGEPPTDIFEPACDDISADTSACDLYSDAHSAANLKYFVENTLARQHRHITSTPSDIYCEAIAFDDQPVRRTRLDTPYEYNDFSSSDNQVDQYEEPCEDPPDQQQQQAEEDEEERWYPVICYEDEGELSVAQLYDLKCGFVPQPCTSTQVASCVRCIFRANEYGVESNAEQAAIMQSLVEQHAKKTAELAGMQYDPEYDGEPMVEEPSDSVESHKVSVDSDTLISSTNDDSLLLNNYDRVSYTEEVEVGDDLDQLETCSDSPPCDNTQSSQSFSCSQPELKYDLLTESDKTERSQTEMTVVGTDNVPTPQANGDISSTVGPADEEDTIIEATPPKSRPQTQIFTVLHTTVIPSEIKTRMLMPKYQPPTRKDIVNSLVEYNIPECRYQEPFYSNVADVTGKMDVGHNVLKIPSNTILDLEEFKSSTGFPGLDTWRREKFKALYPDVDVSKINFHIAFAGQAKVVMVPGAEPPSRQEAEQWVEDRRQAAASAKAAPVLVPKPKMIIPLSPHGNMDDSMSETMTLSPCTPDVASPAPSQTLLVEGSQTTPKPTSLGQRKASGTLQRRALFSQTLNKSLAEKDTTGPVLNLSDTSGAHNNSHQITGAKLDSTSDCKVELQNLQHAKALSEPLNLTIMVVEVYVRTRGDLYPDPAYDAVRAIFYSILNDVPVGAELPRHQTGVLVDNTLDDSTSSSSYLLDGSGVTCDVRYVHSETELMTEFVQLVRKWDPDICAGYEIEMHSWGYLIDRCNVLGINLTAELSRINPAVVKKRAVENAEQDVQITGRIILDVWRLLRHEVALQSYTFENIMYHILHRRVPKFSYHRLTFYWEYKRNFYRHITAKYYVLRVKSVLQLLDQLDLIGRTAELAKLFGIQFYEVLSRGSQFRVESMMLRLAKPLNYIPVSPSVQQRAKMRAPEFLPLIFEPESRFYADPVIVLDFQSLYPSIIIAYNYCFSTCIGRVEMLGSNQPFEFGACQLKVPRDTLRKLDDKLNFSPCGVGYVKAAVRQGILPRMLKEILETRLMVKSSMKENRDDKLLQRVLHSRQLGLKLIANVTYGYTAANFSGRMPCIEVGDSVVSKGRETLERAIKLIEQTPRWRARVVYGDTDSLFVTVAGRSKAEAFRIGAEIAEAVTSDNPAPVKLKLEKVFLPCILQTKKRYVGYMYESVDQLEPEYCAKGIETVRRDGCPAVAKMLENTLRTLFETRDVSLVKRFVCRQFAKLLTGRVSIQDLTFAREFRGASGYRPGACVPALVLARRWAVTDKRREPRRGERVPYVIVNGPPGLPLIRLVRCPRELLADPSRLRPNAVYYITRVIAPALNRCLTLIGADVLAWYKEMPRRQVQMLPTEDAGNVKKSTISQYFATTSCAACGQQSRDGLCEPCSQDPQQSVVVMYMKINNWERTYDEVSLICESCCGRKTDCNSLDCPVLYRLNQLGRDLKQVPYVRRQIAKLSNRPVP